MSFNSYQYIFLFLPITVVVYLSRLQVLERITDEVLAGKIIAEHSIFQYRLFQRLVIEKRKDIPSTIAIGSSRSMVLRAPYLALDQRSYFNHSVPAATLNDYIALLGCYKKKEHCLKR